MSRPRAADDFASIRARVEELRRERELLREDAIELERRAYRQLIREAVLRSEHGRTPLVAVAPEG